MNEQFYAAVDKFCDKAIDNVEYVVFGAAKELHSRLVDITPYRTGRARASWNIAAFSSEDEPAPDIGLGGIDATEDEISLANVFYNSVITSKAGFTRKKGALSMFVTNTVFYIEQLNAGSSKQAPAGFFQATVFSASMIVDRVAKGIANA